MVLAVILVLHFGGLIACCYFDPSNLSGRRPARHPITNHPLKENADV